MAAQVLVMCGQCGRPQAAQRLCSECGAVLPVAPMPLSLDRANGDRAENGHHALMEASFGKGRRIALSARRLEWQYGHGPLMAVDLSEVKSVQLVHRPVYETLVGALVAVGAALLTEQMWLQIVLAGMAALCVMACFGQRRITLKVRTDEGRATLPMGVVASTSRRANRIDNVWDTLKHELSRKGVSIGPRQ